MARKAGRSKSTGQFLWPTFPGKGRQKKGPLKGQFLWPVLDDIIKPFVKKRRKK